MRVQAERSTLSRAPWARASSAARTAAVSIGEARSEYPEMCRQSHANHSGSRSSGSSSVAVARSEAIVRSPSEPTSETTTPFRPAVGPDHLDSARRQIGGEPDARGVLTAPRNTARLRAELNDPGGHVRRLAARARARHGVSVGARGKRLVQPDDDVEQEIAESDDKHGATIVPWTASRGGAVSAPSLSAASSELRRRWPAARRGAGASRPLRRTPQGLEAFEGAPCYHEVVEQEREEL
jgi:hypothetical protein